MRGVSLWFFATGVLFAVLGMIWGIQMSATADHTLSPAHAHLNLLGFVVFALAGLYYHLVPRAAEGPLAKAHYVLALLGVGMIVPGIVQAVHETSETLAKGGSFLTVLAMVLFLVIVLRHRTAA
ncbi:hypothetical protein SAMN04490248_10739 [Salinihabitans flavidus]|uniref:Cytochrome C and Quinol oxidase polypeptide I n=1 Tax=Salinihabitans flavidus TaxID=569882 RepID=A0A1H8QTB8_9RHOB|nr:hypothetical protein [Salinihabitans flavidus]SEO57460.1 hypothetical protein SAMN04490248_10739 [Salinihabitans flavidus]